MNVADYEPMVNIIPFGNCFSMLNPAVQNGEMDIEGLQKAPCVPVITERWAGGKEDVLIEGEPALLSDCTTFCIHGGLIQIEDDGQELDGTSVG